MRRSSAERAREGRAPVVAVDDSVRVEHRDNLWRKTRKKRHSGSVREGRHIINHIAHDIALTERKRGADLEDEAPAEDLRLRARPREEVEHPARIRIHFREATRPEGYQRRGRHVRSGSGCSGYPVGSAPVHHPAAVGLPRVHPGREHNPAAAREGVRVRAADTGRIRGQAVWRRTQAAVEGGYDGK